MSRARGGPRGRKTTLVARRPAAFVTANGPQMHGV